MENNSEDCCAICKALSDPIRLKIVQLLSGTELCACVILEKFSITQPTLSHHMRTLCSLGLVKARKSGKWTYYCLDRQTLQKLSLFINDL